MELVFDNQKYNYPSFLGGLVLSILICFGNLANATTIFVPGDAATIQEAVDMASSGDIVQIAAGTYHDCTHPDPDAGGGAFSYNCVIMKSGVSLMGDTGNPGNVVIDAQSAGRVIYCANLEDPVTIAGVTIRNGWCGGGLPGTTNSPAQITPFDGGGLAIDNATFTLSHCNIESNHADTGGGIFYIGGSGYFSISNCIFSQNTAVGFGGGITGSPDNIEFCHFYENGAAFGGGAYSSTNFESCLFEANDAGAYGGAVSGYDFSLINCSFIGNVAHGPGGGAVSVAPSGHLYAYNTDFESNESPNGIGPGGLVEMNALAELNCCLTVLADWQGDGTTIMDNDECPVSTTLLDWGSIKAMFR